VPSRFPRQEITRIVVPLAFLAAVTILVLLIHSALSGGGKGTATTTVKRRHHSVTTTTAQTTTRQTTTQQHHTVRPARFYVVVAGDTFGSIASKEGTTVAKLVQLNPNADSSALSIGQKIRVG
jgi:LysM repeat protein